MTLTSEISQRFLHQYGVLILDNEVTVSHFVTQPPLAWNRIIQKEGIYQMAPGYPVTLTAEQAHREARVWDRVSMPGILRVLQECGECVASVVIGNNAGQGLPLAENLPTALRGERGVIIYGESLPQIQAYQRCGYQTFLKRSDLLGRLQLHSQSAALPLGIAFVNTIQHDASSFHEP